MKRHQLEYLLAVSKYQSFTGAAEKLHTSQPYLSTQIKELERELKATLLLRDKKRCCLTPAGKIVQKRAETIFQLIEAAEKELQAYVTCGAAATIRIGTNLIDIDHTFAEILLKFQAVYPHVNVNFCYYYDLEAAMAADEIDMGVGLFLTPSESLSKELLYTENYLLCLPRSHKLAQTKQVSWKDISQLPFVCYTQQIYEQQLFNAWEQEHKQQTHKLICECPSLHLLLATVVEKQASCLLPYSLSEHLAPWPLTTVTLEAAPMREIYLIRNPQTTFSQAHHYFYQLLHYLF